MPLIAQQVVPHGFIAIVGDREWHARQGILQRYSALERLGPHGILRRVVEQPLRQGHGAMGREDVDAKGRITLEQFLGRSGQLARILGRILAGDHHPRRIAGERVGAHRTALLIAGRWRGQPTGVGRDAAVGVTGFLGTDAGQGGAEFRRQVGGYGRLCAAGDGQRQSAGQ